MGVLHRIEKLADRKIGFEPKGAPPFYSVIPLREIIAEVFNRGVKTKAVDNEYMRLLKELGNELSILITMPPKDIVHADSPRIAEAISRMRKGDVNIKPGFDGEYGKVKTFDKADG
jgi:PHP family Zn ribbon phosphoesterase